MRTSIVIATHNEGPLLEKTIASVRETTSMSETEIVVLDDGSTDGSAAAVAARDARIRFQRYEQRVGVARAKHDAALMASGEVLVFLDGHCKPETGAIDRLVEDVLLTLGDAIFTPRVCPLDTATWENKPEESGHGYVMRLDMMKTRWRDLEQMQLVTLDTGREVYETPNLQGCVRR